MAQKVTEEEAKKKWCRHGQQFEFEFQNRNSGIAVAAASANRTNSGLAKTKCYASDCMAWEWDKEGNDLGLKGSKRRGFCDAENNGGKVVIL